MGGFAHIEFGRAVSLPDVGPLRQRLIAIGHELRLRGTILLHPEGFRLSVVGRPEAIPLLLTELRAQPGLASLDLDLDLNPDIVVRSLPHQPFKRWIVRVFREAEAWREEPMEALAAPVDSSSCITCLPWLLDPSRRQARLAPGAESEEPCPGCGRPPFAQLATSIEGRHARIRHAVTPLPGRVPFDNFKPVRIPPECDGGTLVNALCHLVEHVSVEDWERECALGRLLNCRDEILAAQEVVRGGDRYWHKFPGILEPDVDGRVEILHEDEALLILNKPAPLPMHAGGRYFRNTLQHILRAAYHPETPFPAHRLDANTTGLVLVARNRFYAGLLQPQFARGQVQKSYLVRVQGQPDPDRFECDAPISCASGALGSRAIDLVDGRSARTEFRVLARNAGDGTTLLEARPFTGRTHQIRVHLWHLGWPVCGDPAYRPGNQLGQTQTLAPGEPALCLHAWQMRFEHPLTRTPVEFTAPPPRWADPLNPL